MTFERMHETIVALKDLLPPYEHEVWIDYLIRVRNSKLITMDELYNLTARLKMEYFDLSVTKPI